MEKLTVDEFIRQAVEEGASNAPHVFMNNLEQSLRNDVIVNEAGSMENYLQNLINDTVEDIEQNPISEDDSDDQGQGNGYHVTMDPKEYEEWMMYKNKDEKNAKAKATLKS